MLFGRSIEGTRKGVGLCRTAPAVRRSAWCRTSTAPVARSSMRPWCASRALSAGYLGVLGSAARARPKILHRVQVRWRHRCRGDLRPRFHACGIGPVRRRAFAASGSRHPCRRPAATWPGNRRRRPSRAPPPRRTWTSPGRSPNWGKRRCGRPCGSRWQGDRLGQLPAGWGRGRHVAVVPFRRSLEKPQKGHSSRTAAESPAPCGSREQLTPASGLGSPVCATIRWDCPKFTGNVETFEPGEIRVPVPDARVGRGQGETESRPVHGGNSGSDLRKDVTSLAMSGDSPAPRPWMTRACYLLHKEVTACAHS